LWATSVASGIVVVILVVMYGYGSKEKSSEQVSDCQQNNFCALICDCNFTMSIKLQIDFLLMNIL